MCIAVQVCFAHILIDIDFLQQSLVWFIVNFYIRYVILGYKQKVVLKSNFSKYKAITA
ncbi:hypothetical protein BD560DRAFT_416921 [Blakeslea trispora]|nr:hypothetical protein BD560DRAFT_416921 [Blakeslea trispora]